MGDAMPIASEERAVTKEDTAQARDGEEHGKVEEDKTQGTTAEEQGKSEEELAEQRNGGDGEGDVEDELSECPFCLFMKSGPCRDSFISWENCIEQAEKEKEDMVEKCHKVTFMLKECMERNSDYYEPVLQAEKAMGDAALEEEEEDPTAPEGSVDANPSDLQVPSQSENQHSSDASLIQTPQHVDTEEHHVHTEEHHVHTEEHSAHASSDEHHVRSSADAASEVAPPADSRGAAKQ